MKWVTHWEALLFPDIKGLMVSVSFSFPLFWPPAGALMGTGEQNTVFGLKGLCLHDLNLGLFTVALLQEEARLGNFVNMPLSAKPSCWIWLLARHIDVRLSTEVQQRAKFCIIEVVCYMLLLLLLLQFSPMITVLTTEPFKWQKWIQFCTKRSTFPSLCLESASCSEKRTNSIILTLWCVGSILAGKGTNILIFSVTFLRDLKAF